MSPAPPQSKKDPVALATLLHTVGDPHRLAILCSIFSRPNVCVSDIAKRLHVPIATVSHHLRVLARVGIVKAQREGKEVCYMFNVTSRTRDLKKFICKYKK